MPAMRAGMALLGADQFTSAVDNLVAAWSGADELEVLTDVDYAPHQEYGTVHQKGTPHVRPAIEATKSAMLSIAATADSLQSYLRRVANHLLHGIQRRAPVDTGRLRRSYRVESAGGGR